MTQSEKYGYLLYFFTAVFILFLGMVYIEETDVREVSETQVQTTKNEAPQVALTFDDGPSIYTRRLLEGLKERDVKASFFLLGECIEGNEDTIKFMHEEGHLIGNHTYEHVQLSTLSQEAARCQIERTSNMIYEITGVYTAFVRPPYGEWKDGLDLKITMVPVFWSIDSLDWTTKNVEATIQRVVSNVEDGDIILMHDCYDSSVKSALGIVDALQKKGYTFVTVDQLIFR